MNNQNTAISSQSKRWQSWLVLFLRWIFGRIAGFTIGFFLLFLSETGIHLF